jgi:hypothetical protein
MIYLAVLTDVIHALLMLSWIVGLPLLFWHRYPRLSVAYCIYSLLFIIVNQVSHYTFGCCVFTVIAGWFYQQAGWPVTNEWFIVRAANLILGLTIPHRGIKIATELMVALSAFGVLYLYAKGRISHVGRKQI